MNQIHLKELVDQRLYSLEKEVDDHEARLRQVSEGVTQFKTWSGLAVGGSWLTAPARWPWSLEPGCIWRPPSAGSVPWRWSFRPSWRRR